MPDVLLRAVKDHTLILRMNRTERRNALGGGLSEALQEAWRDYMADDNLWCAVLTGNGRAFSAGADIRAAADRYAGEGAGQASARRAPEVEVYKPVIAAVNGYAVAGGMMLAARCDIRIAADNAEFWMGEVRWSMTTPYKIMLAWHMPLGVLMELTLTGNRISAQRAYEIGFVNKLVPPGQLMDAAMEMADGICRNAPIAVRAHKESIMRLLEVPRSLADPIAREIMQQISQSEDAREGTKAFAEKRTPIWRNR